MSRTVLVTGADGFVGTGLVKSLEAAGHCVFKHSIADGDIARCPLPFEGVEHVFHLAARTYVPASWENPPAFYEVNVLGTANVLEFCRRQKASVTLISSYVYGHPEKLPISEDHPLKPFNPYGHSKIIAEDLGRYYESAFGVHLSVLRPFNLYGPGQSPNFLLPTLISQAISPDSPAINIADDRPRRDYLYIDDFIELLTRFAEADQTGAFNAGSGMSTSIGELVDMINSLLGSPKPLVCRGEHRPGDVLDLYADISRARGLLGWQPKTTLIDGLRKTMEHMRKAQDGI